ncbi:alpha-2 adrenergic receptor [Trichonephila clavipes]|uniref:Alpha-2 adrenergic receptor n=1 Tax=Trichonephila clavipes TaxID=2585209 RepID=A0A8X7BG08_TRICX|nr:alpha-2 adrenergic receptor [Trichonephila clavipes]
MKIGNNGNYVWGPFDESTPCLMIVLMNCQTKLRINHLTAVKSVAILESKANLNFYTWKKKHSLDRCKLARMEAIEPAAVASVWKIQLDCDIEELRLVICEDIL